MFIFNCNECSCQLGRGLYKKLVSGGFFYYLLYQYHLFRVCEITGLECVEI